MLNCLVAWNLLDTKARARNAGRSILETSLSFRRIANSIELMNLSKLKTDLTSGTCESTNIGVVFEDRERLGSHRCLSIRHDATNGRSACGMNPE